jgi:hypothetical protein
MTVAEDSAEPEAACARWPGVVDRAPDPGLCAGRWKAGLAECGSHGTRHTPPRPSHPKR